jgi:CheY-like chemotaxis protein
MHRVRILVLDRQADHAETLKLLFESRDCVVLRSADQCDAMQLVKAHRPDVVIADLDIDGAHAVMQAAKETNPLGALVVCLSGRQVKTRQECDIHLLKPYSIEDLDAAIQRFVEERGRQKKASNGQR